MTQSITMEATSDSSGNAVVENSASLRQLLADVFSLYLTAKGFRWQIMGRRET